MSNPYPAVHDLLHHLDLLLTSSRISMSDSPDALEILPLEIIQRILSFCDRASLRAMSQTSSEYRTEAQKALFRSFRSCDLRLIRLREAHSHNPKMLDYIRHISLQGHPRRVSQMSALTSLRCVTSVYFQELQWLEFVQLWNSWKNLREFKTMCIFVEEDDWVAQELEPRALRVLELEACKNSTAFYKIVAASRCLRSLRIPFRPEWQEHVPESFLADIGGSLEVLEVFGDINDPIMPRSRARHVLLQLAQVNPTLREVTYWGHWSIGLPLHRMPKLEYFSLISSVNWCTAWDLMYALSTCSDKAKTFHFMLVETRLSNMYGPQWSCDHSVMLLNSAKARKVNFKLEIWGGQSPMGGNYDTKTDELFYEWTTEPQTPRAPYLPLEPIERRDYTGLTSRRVVNPDPVQPAQPNSSEVEEDQDDGPIGPLYLSDDESESETGTVIHHESEDDNDEASDAEADDEGSSGYLSEDEFAELIDVSTPQGQSLQLVPKPNSSNRARVPMSYEKGRDDALIRAPIMTLLRATSCIIM